MRAKVEGVSIQDNGLVEVPHFPKLIVPTGEMKCKVAQQR